MLVFLVSESTPLLMFAFCLDFSFCSEDESKQSSVEDYCIRCSTNIKMSFFLEDRKGTECLPTYFAVYKLFSFLWDPHWFGLIEILTAQSG